MSNIAIIPARGGSKRIPKKNIKEFCGKPIIMYSILAAIESEMFDKVMVSTDSEEIAIIAERYGAEVPFYRSSKTADDFATTSEVLFEVLTEYAERSLKYEYGCCIYPTAPFVNGKVIRKAMEKLLNSHSDTVIPMVGFSYPPQRGFVECDDHFIMKWPQYIDSRSQDLQKLYHDCGQFYCFRVKSFMDNRNLLTGTIDGIILSEMNVQDIDTLEDWEIAEIKYRIQTRKSLE